VFGFGYLDIRCGYVGNTCPTMRKRSRRIRSRWKRSREKDADFDRESSSLRFSGFPQALISESSEFLAVRNYRKCPGRQAGRQQIKSQRTKDINTLTHRYMYRTNGSAGDSFLVEKKCVFVCECVCVCGNWSTKLIISHTRT